MAIPNYLNINRPEGIQQQIVTLIQYVERYYPEYVEVVREIIYNYVPVDVQKILEQSMFYRPLILNPLFLDVNPVNPEDIIELVPLVE